MPAQQPPRQVPIAIVGISALLPGSTDIGGFWRNIVTGADLITDVPPSRWLVEDYYDPDMFAPGKTYCRRGAFLGEMDFDSLHHGIPPADLPHTDTSQLLALVAAEAALADATGGRIEALDRDRVGVIFGVAGLELGGEMAATLGRPVLVKALRDQRLPESRVQAICDAMAGMCPAWRETTFPGLLGNVVAGRVANRFDLHGTNCTTDAACASSLAALSMAADELALGRADLMLTGGVDTLNDIFAFMCFSKTPALSPSGDCRPFAADADGTMLGEGLVMFVLKRLADAEADADRIYAVITGIGSSSDGRGTSIYAPVAAGQVRALRRAYDSAGYGPDTVELVEAHGTGTIAGDLAECQALREVFDGTGRADRQWCALGSVKSQYGHTKATAGAVGLLKTVLALHHKVLPPTIKVSRPDPRLDLSAGPLYLNTHTRPWISAPDRPRRAGVSSFGFGGTNFHVALQEYRGPAAHRARVVPDELVLLSADSAAGLRRRGLELAGGTDLAETARVSQRDFRPDLTARLAVVAASTEELRDKLGLAATRLEQDPGTSFTTPTGMYYGTGATETARVAFVFPGQGSQYLGMGGDLALHVDRARAVWDRCESILPGLREVVFPVPAFTDAERATQAERLRATEWAQPALAVHGMALLELLDMLGLRPDCVAGHSFGELLALYAAGVFTADDLLRRARRRGELMRDAARVPGAMTAALAGAEDVTAALVRGDVPEVWVANHNGPAEVVLSGTVTAIGQAEEVLAGHGITTRRLNTATAFHTPLMAPAVGAMAEHLAAVDVRTPSMDVYGNADAAPYPTEPDQIRDRLATHLCTPVRWAETVEAMYEAGIRVFVEVGAGAVLTGTVRRILGDAPHTAIATDRAGVHGITALHRALGQLSALGVPLNLDPLWAGHAPPTPAAGSGRPVSITKITGRNLGRTYPPPGGAAALPPPNPEPDPAGPTLSAADGNWMCLVGHAQEQTAEAHTAYQRAMADSHATYLRLAETSMAALAAAMTGGGVPTAMPVPPVFPEPAVTEPVPLPAPIATTNGSAPDPAALGPAATAAAAMLARIGQDEKVDLAAIDLEALLCEIVADRTGYPIDVIGMDLDLDADLGVDSIKRVELLASLQPHVPWLPQVDEVSAPQLAEMMAMRTLGEIAARIRAELVALQGDPERLRTSLTAARSGPAMTPGDLTALARLAGGGRAGPKAPAAGLTRLVVRACLTEPEGLPMPGLGEAELVVTDDGAGVAEAVVAALAERGVAARVVPAVPAGAGAVMFLDGLGAVASPEEAIQVQRTVFAAARALAPRLAEDGGVLVTVQDTGGDFGLRGAEPNRAWLGGLAALARTAGREWPRATVKAIDCERTGRDAGTVAAAIVAELCAGGDTPEVGLRADGTRYTLAGVPAPAEPDATVRFGPDDVVVVTGGARGVTAAAVLALARAHHPRLVLLGRTPLAEEPDAYPEASDEASLTRVLANGNGHDPTAREPRSRARELLAAREVRHTLAGLAEAGVAARYIALDVTDREAVERAMDEVRADWGLITGLVHAAGVLADKSIAEKTDEDFDAVFGTKVAGLRVLLAATAADPLRLLCGFSSVVARFGNAGQCDYAMANETLNQVLCGEAARRPGCVVRSLLWGPWRGGMVSTGLASLFEASGVELIEPAEGASAFAAELATATTGTQVVLSTPAALSALEHRAAPTGPVREAMAR